MIEQFTDEQVEQYRDDGFLIVEDFLPKESVEILLERFEQIFEGNHDLVVAPDELYWQKGRDPEDAQRVVGGVWRVDRQVGGQAFGHNIGRLSAQLEGASSTRMLGDFAIYKPEGGRPFDLHQDGSYLGWVQPVWYWTFWVALSDTYADGGTLVYVRGSHKWGPYPPSGEAIAAHDRPLEGWTDYVEQLAPEGTKVELVPLEVEAGTAAFHTGWMWHGSGPNTRKGYMRRGYGIAMISGTSRHHPRLKNEVYSRYFAPGQVEFDEDFFPVMWSADGHRTPWLDGYADQELPIAASSPDAVLMLDELEVEPWTAWTAG